MLKRLIKSNWGSTFPSISVKLFAGFGVVLALLAIIATVAVIEFEHARDSFVDYSSLARQSNQLGRIQANLLEARLRAKNFIIDQSEENIAGVKERAIKALEFINQGEKLARESSYLIQIGLSEKLSHILKKEGERITQYLAHFNRALELQTTRNEIVHNRLDTVGAKLEADVSLLLSDSYDAGKFGSAIQISSALRSLLLMRLFTGKFLINNDQASYSRAIAESKEFSAILETLLQSISLKDGIKRVGSLQSGSRIYEAAIKDVKKTIDSRNTIIRNQLNTLGPSIARAVEDVKLELLREQLSLDSSTAKELTFAAAMIISVCIIGFVIGTGFALIFGRRISTPVLAMTKALNALASGDKSSEIPGREYKDEIGDMAKAAQVFKEKTIEADELAQQVADRTIQLEQKSNELHVINSELEKELALRKKIEAQLVHTQKLESIGTLAGGIAHDFNNMLAVISSSAQVALDHIGRNDYDPVPALKRIESATRQSKSVVHQILSFSRHDTTENLERIDLGKVVQEALTLLRAGIPTSIELDMDVPINQFFVDGDISKVQQVVVNLVNNAYYACEENKGSIRVTLEKIEISETDFPKFYPLKTGPYVKLRVSDDGIGISKDDMPLIFDPFFTTKAVGEGTGLGLSVVHGTVNAHKGIIHCDSELGTGTTIEIYLPCVNKNAH